ncbi:MFS transporter [Saccharopolyspora rhizosphaerae]|uniref:MFS transporter n=1 Tax=Saccharopolyspora rhizosphaerae TaxID=2492662 RepID=A0A3R8QAG5_9PSEU|nr:MFS transporter [Saccharopolyspora rhizosphaerae]RRO20561.1 MFS transporter [Saccharopolyspora rhizosphaerae]
MNRQLAGLIASTAISGLGTGMTMLAIPWFALVALGGTLHTGLVVAAETTGLLVGSAIGGGWVDRLGARRAAVTFDLTAAAVVTTVPALHHLEALTEPALIALAAALGLARAPAGTARHVLVPDIAARTGMAVERVTSAHDAPQQGAHALGAPVAGVVIAVLSAPAALLLDAVSFLLAAAITQACLPATRRSGPRSRGVAALREGWRFVLGDRTLLAIMSMVAVTNGLNAGLFTVLVPAYGVQVLGSPVQLGAVFAATSAALIVGSVGFALLGLRWPRRPTVAVCYLLVLGPRAAIFALQPPLWLLVALSRVLMLAFGPLNPILGAVKAERTPPAMRARAYAVISTAALAGMPLGTVLAGAVSAQIGLIASFALFAAAATGMSLCPLLFPAWRGLERPPTAAAATV